VHPEIMHAYGGQPGHGFQEVLVGRLERLPLVTLGQ